jgi:hypothetical protein
MSTPRRRHIPSTSFLGRSAETWRTALQRHVATRSQPAPAGTNTGDDHA